MAILRYVDARKMRRALLQLAGIRQTSEVVGRRLEPAAIIDWPTLVIGLASAALLLTVRINSAWLIVAAGVFGWLYRG